MSKRLIGATAVALSIVSAPALAQTAPPPGVAQGTAPVGIQHSPPIVRGPMIRQMPMEDRVMTRDQVVQHVRAMFARFDTNHDGYITRDELVASRSRMMGEGHGPMAGRMREERVETHGPGGSMGMADPNAMFDRLDTNHDGVISRQEFLAGHKEIHERRMVIMRGADEHRGGMHMMGGGGFGEHLFAMADANHDGRVSLQEAEAAALAHFDRADLNHDGKLTPEERRQAHQAMGGHPPH
jgi:Ca2+-binding EF-hand superfamily protein